MHSSETTFVTRYFLQKGPIWQIIALISITIAQALHWFDLDNFYKEARRVLRKEDNGSSGNCGVIAAWAYGLHSVSPEIDTIVHLLYEDIVGPYWSKERKIVENKYQDISFPFQEIETPAFRIELDWDLSELIGYLNTWSSVQKYIEKNNSDPVKQIYDDLAGAWGEKQIWHKRRVVWPIYMKVGKSQHKRSPEIVLMTSIRYLALMVKKSAINAIEVVKLAASSFFLGAGASKNVMMYALRQFHNTHS